MNEQDVVKNGSCISMEFLQTFVELLLHLFLHQVEVSGLIDKTVKLGLCVLAANVMQLSRLKIEGFASSLLALHTFTVRMYLNMHLGTL